MALITKYKDYKAMLSSGNQFENFKAYHIKNRYDLNPNQEQLLKQIAEEVGEEPLADVTKAPSYEDYRNALSETLKIIEEDRKFDSDLKDKLNFELNFLMHDEVQVVVHDKDAQRITIL